MWRVTGRVSTTANSRSGLNRSIASRRRGRGCGGRSRSVCSCIPRRTSSRPEKRIKAEGHRVATSTSEVDVDRRKLAVGNKLTTQGVPLSVLVSRAVWRILIARSDTDDVPPVRKRIEVVVEIRIDHFVSVREGVCLARAGLNCLMKKLLHVRTDFLEKLIQQFG